MKFKWLVIGMPTAKNMRAWGLDFGPFALVVLLDPK